MIKPRLTIVVMGCLFCAVPPLAHAQSKAKSLSLHDAIAAALEQSIPRKQSILETKRARAEYQEQKARFDISVSSSFRYEQGASSTQGTQNMLATGFSQGRFELGAQKPLPFGGSFEIGLGIVRSRNAIALPSATGPNEVQVQEYFLRPNFTYRQPILQNAGRKVAKAPIRKAKALVGRSTASEQLQRLNTVRDVSLAYWDLKSAQLNVEACIKARSLVLSQIETTKLLITEGRRASRDLFALEQELSVKDIELQEAQTEVHNQGSNLMLLMGLPLESKGQEQLLTSAPLQDPVIHPTHEQPSLTQSLQGNPELTALSSDIEALRQDLIVAQNQRKPALDAFVAAGTRGLSRDALSEGQTRDPGSWKKAFQNFFNSASPPGLVDYSITAGLELTWSPRNRQAQARVEKANLDLQAALLALARKRQELLTQLGNARKTSQSLHSRWSIAKRSVDLAKQNLEVEQDRFQAGYATNDDLLLRINELYQAQRRRGQIQIDWIKAQVRYAAMSGTLLIPT